MWNEEEQQWQPTHSDRLLITMNNPVGVTPVLTSQMRCGPDRPRDQTPPVAQHSQIVLLYGREQRTIPIILEYTLNPAYETERHTYNAEREEAQHRRQQLLLLYGGGLGTAVIVIIVLVMALDSAVRQVRIRGR